MQRRLGPVLSLALAASTALGPPSPSAAQGGDHLLITEFGVTPTDGEFVEIFNPTSDSIDVSNYYISDFVLKFDGEIDNANNYWHVTDGLLRPDPNFPNDFLAHFPAGTVMAPGQTFVISMHDDALFSGYWSTSSNPVPVDFELIQDGDSDGVRDMVDPGPKLIGDNYIQSGAGLSNAREVVVLFYWDGESDLVDDVDIVQWSNAGANFVTVSPNKTGVMVNGQLYEDDTEPIRQELAHTGAHDFGFTVSRRDFSEGTETLSGGNGLTGHDETSEDYTQTWLANTDHSIGNPGRFGPPEVTNVAAATERSLTLTYSRTVQRGAAEATGNYEITQVESENGDATNVPLAVESATLDVTGTVVMLVTGPQVPVALYRLTATNILAEGTAELIITKPVEFRGYNARSLVELDVPRHPYVPTFDGFYEINYTAPQGETVLLRMFDLQGRELFVLAEERVPAGGRQTIRWNGRDELNQRLPAGAYMLHIRMEGTGDEVVAPVVIATSETGAGR